MIGRKYMILDTRAKALALDEHKDPLRFVSLDEALAKAIELRGRKSADAFGVVENLRTSVEFRAPGETCWMSYADREA
ncbi:hypothetical protein [Bradyrhizobium sp. USDA 4452]